MLNTLPRKTPRVFSNKSINLEKAIFGDAYDQEYHVKVAATPQEIKALLEVGYEYVCKETP